MTRRIHVLNARLLLALLIASLGMAGLAGGVTAQTDDDAAPVAEASPSDVSGESGEGETEDTSVNALPETGQGTAASNNSAPILLLVGVAGVIVAGGVMLIRIRRA